MSPTIRPLLRPSAGRVVGALYGVAVASVAALLLITTLDDTMIQVGFASIPVAAGVGWLLGPRAASGDWWTAAGTAVVAAVAGIVVGAFVVAGVSSPIWTTSLGEAIGYTLVIGIVGAFVGAAPALLLGLPATLAWAFLVRWTMTRLRRAPAVLGGPSMQPGRRRRIPSKGGRRAQRGAIES